MITALKIIVVFLVITTGCTVITEASKIRCYIEIDDYVEYDSSEIEKMMDSPPYFIKNLRTFLWIHGFNATETGPAITTMVTGALNKGGWNVCLWNWVKEARAYELIGTELSYIIKVGAVPWVGYEMAGAVRKVVGKGLNLPGLHVYGHSLGAHVAGYCGSTLKNSIIKPLQLERINGLDPAGPFFGPGRALQTGDAKYVGCIHTDAGNNGINSSNCDKDIWVNKGQRIQPGCPKNDSGDRFSDPALCSHNFSWKVQNASFFYDFFMSFGINYGEWAESNGTATPITLLGEKTDTTLRGNYYLFTSGEYPYTLGLDGLRPYF